MIKINKDCKVPRVLVKKGPELTGVVCATFDEDRNAYLDGSKKLPRPDASVYGHRTVKDTLRACQYNKCCYSEAKFVGDYGDIEHFRPKSLVVDHETGERIYPGYYWLAYDWDNLLLCKQIPNQSAKRNYFPIGTGSARARKHDDDISAEEALLINPAIDDPRDHMRFHADEPVAHNGSPKGQVSIDYLGLCHDHLVEQRRTHLAHLRRLVCDLKFHINVGNKEKAQECQAALEEFFTAPTAEFRSMTIDYLKQERLEIVFK